MLEAGEAEALEQAAGLPRAPAAAPTPRLRSARAALSIAESQGSSMSRWGMKAQRARRAVGDRGAPPTSTSPCAGLLQAADQLEQGRLAAAGGPDQAEHAVGAELEVEPLDRPQLAVGVPQAADRDGRRGGASAQAGDALSAANSLAFAGILVSWRTRAPDQEGQESR